MISRWSIFTACFFLTTVCHAKPWVDSVSAGVGFGSPHALKGGRLALQKNWGERYEWEFWDNKLVLSGYWDLSAAYWHTNSDYNNNHLFAYAIAPVFRLSSTNPLTSMHIYPYLEASVGASYLTAEKMGRRHYGSRFNFQDLMGVGIRFGKNKQYDLSYHYLHYSNANMFPPNQGVDVKALFLFRYFFS